MPLDEPRLTTGTVVWPLVWAAGWWGAFYYEPTLIAGGQTAWPTRWLEGWGSSNQPTLTSPSEPLLEA